MTATGTATATPAMAKIKLFSLLGAEAVAWSVAGAHLVKWAVDAFYFLTTQVRYLITGAFPWIRLRWGAAALHPRGGFTYWWLKDTWDHLPRHLGHLLHVAWLTTAKVDRWWVTPRHDARGLIIGIVTGVVVAFLFTKPSLRRRRVRGLSYALAVPKALVWAAPGVAIGVLALWRVPWVTRHGLGLPPSSPVSTEVNGWASAGHWHLLVLGLLGSLFFAKYATRRTANEGQWFFAERSAARHLRPTGLTGAHVWGPPGFRARVHWALDHGITPVHGKWAARVLLAAVPAAAALTAFGFWLTTWGPAAGA